ncbi:hypothetical protein V0M98_36960 (plasmid) [Pseudomonas silesiensis]|uniref:hypothetical protein n=1 Tax=Pseudomonas silesiensis TaxID=1853130 RepID=UPI0030D3A62B
MTTSSVPTPSAQAMHLLCCMNSSLVPSFYDNRQWAGKHPLSHCVSENLQPLDPADPGLSLLGKMSRKGCFLADDLMDELRQDLSQPFNKDISQVYSQLQEHAHALLELKKKPGGWLQVEALWEHFTGTSLSHVLEHVPITDHMDPSDDFSNGCRYFVESVWYQDSGDCDDGDACYYVNPIPQVLVANDLATLLSKLELHAQRCDEFLVTMARNPTRLDAIKIDICNGSDTRIMSLGLPDMGEPKKISKVRFDLRELKIHGQREIALDAIKKGLGENRYLNHIGNDFGRDIGL